MEPLAIEDKLCHARRDLLRIGMGWEITAKSQIHAEEANALWTFIQMAVARDDKAIVACRLVEPSADVGDALAGIVPWEDEREHIGSMSRS
jgi:hypothetical protein